VFFYSFNREQNLAVFFLSGGVIQTLNKNDATFGENIFFKETPKIVTWQFFNETILKNKLRNIKLVYQETRKCNIDDFFYLNCNIDGLWDQEILPNKLIGYSSCANFAT
jgi:hypothetical protein